jgi:hypothetical protein
MSTGIIAVPATPWDPAGGEVAADGWLLGAVLSTAFGYVAGARVSAEVPASQVICWILVFSLPLTVPAAWWLDRLSVVLLSVARRLGR